jgi:myo-inositol-hexaphosphate 3-phosphohydrolase
MKTGALYILKIEVNLWKYSRAAKNYRVDKAVTS